MRGRCRRTNPSAFRRLSAVRRSWQRRRTIPQSRGRIGIDGCRSDARYALRDWGRDFAPPYRRRRSMPRFQLRRTGAAAALLLMLAGCTVGPDYHPPEPAMPPEWQEMSSGVIQHPGDLTRWWTLLGDPTLDELVGDAIKGNLPLREAVARVDESRARYREARS